MAAAADVPLSPAQRAIFWESAMTGGRPNTGILVAEISGMISPELIRQACAHVSHNHRILRSRVRQTAQGLKYTEAPPDQEIDFLVVRAPAPSANDGDLAALSAALLPAHWDVTADPPIRFRLVERPARPLVLVVLVHHIAFDGTSKEIFADCFNAFIRNPRQPGTPDESQSRDTRVTPANVALAAAYWKTRGLGHRNNLPAPLGVNRADAFVSSSPLTFSRTGTIQLYERLAARRLSRFVLSLGVTAVHLTNYGNRKALLAVPVDCRRPGESIRIGMYVNIVPVQLSVNPRESLDDVLQKAGRAVRYIVRTRHTPYVEVVNALRRTSGSDVARLLSQTALSVPKASTSASCLFPDGTITWHYALPSQTTTFDIGYHVRLTDDNIHLRVDSTQAVLDQSATDQIAADWLRTLEMYSGAWDRTALSGFHQRSLSRQTAPRAPGRVDSRTPAKTAPAPGYLMAGTHPAFCLPAADRPVRFWLTDAVLGHIGTGSIRPGVDPVALGTPIDLASPWMSAATVGPAGQHLPDQTPGWIWVESETRRWYPTAAQGIVTGRRLYVGHLSRRPPTPPAGFTVTPRAVEAHFVSVLPSAVVSVRNPASGDRPNYDVVVAQQSEVASLRRLLSRHWPSGAPPLGTVRGVSVATFDDLGLLDRCRLNLVLNRSK